MHTTTKTRTYSSTEIRRLTGTTMRELEYWVNTGVVTPSAEPAATYRGPLRRDRLPTTNGHRAFVGSGYSRRYTEADVHRITILKMLRTAGVELSRLRHADLSAIRTDIEHAFEEAERAGLCG